MVNGNVSQPRKPKIFYGYIIIAAAFLITAVMFGMTFTFGVFLKPISAELGWGNAVISGAFSMTLLISGFFGIPAGRLSDKFGPRKVAVVCSLFFGSGYLLMSQINTMWQLYLFQGLIIGIGLSACIAPLQSTVVKWFAKRRGLVVGIFLMGGTTGNMIMPPIADQLILIHGWRTAYIMLGAATFLVAFLAALLLKRDPAQIGQLPYGADEVEKHGPQLQQMTGSSLGEAFHTVQFWLLCAFFFFFCYVMVAIMAHIVPHAINLGISSTTSAVVLAVIGGTATGARIPVGIMIDKLGNKRTTITVTALLAISMLWLLVAGKETWSLFLFAVIFGLAFSSVDILLTILVSSSFGLISLGAIIGFVNCILQMGCSLGIFISGLICDLTGSYHLAFLLCMIFSVIALIIAFFFRPESGGKRRLTE